MLECLDVWMCECLSARMFKSLNVSMCEYLNVGQCECLNDCMFEWLHVWMFQRVNAWMTACLNPVVFDNNRMLLHALLFWEEPLAALGVFVVSNSTSLIRQENGSSKNVWRMAKIIHVGMFEYLNAWVFVCSSVGPGCLNVWTFECLTVWSVRLDVWMCECLGAWRFDAQLWIAIGTAHWMFEWLNVWMVGGLNVWMFERLSVWVLECLMVWMFECLNVWMFACPMCEGLMVWKFECLSVWWFQCLNVWMLECLANCVLPQIFSATLPIPELWSPGSSRILLAFVLLLHGMEARSLERTSKKHWRVALDTSKLHPHEIQKKLDDLGPLLYRIHALLWLWSSRNPRYFIYDQSTPRWT